MPDSIIDNDNISRQKYIGKDFKLLYDALSNVRAQCKKGGCKFQEHQQFLSLDCVDIFLHPSDPHLYYGIFQNLNGDFKLFLSSSKDGYSWENPILIDDQASKGNIWFDDENGNILLAYEMIADEMSHIRIRYYDGL